MTFLQRRIVSIVGILVLLMPIYAAYELLGRNMGYAWLFFPPHFMATINAGQLIAQWMAVVLIGGVAFLLAKDLPDSFRFDSIRAVAIFFGAGSKQKGKIETPTNSTSPLVTLLQKVETNPVVRQAVRSALASVNSSRHGQESLKEPVDESVVHASNPLYEAFLNGPRAAYYLPLFSEFDKRNGTLSAGWNWAAFCGGGIWALYRKMYGLFVAFWAILLFVTVLGASLVLALFNGSGIDTFILLIFWSLQWFLFPVYADALYHRHAKAVIASASHFNSPQALIEYLRNKGGVHRWVIWVFSLYVISIFAAIIVRMFVDD